MSGHEVALRSYVLAWNGAAERWELRLGFGPGGAESVVARSVPGEGKDDFESICREYVRRHSLSAQRHLPRTLRIRNMEGQVIEDAEYDVDAL